MPRPLPEILADVDSALRRTDSALLVNKIGPAREALGFIRQALGTIAHELALRPRQNHDNVVDM